MGKVKEKPDACFQAHLLVETHGRAINTPGNNACQYVWVWRAREVPWPWCPEFSLQTSVAGSFYPCDWPYYSVSSPAVLQLTQHKPSENTLIKQGIPSAQWLSPESWSRVSLPEDRSFLEGGGFEPPGPAELSTVWNVLFIHSFLVDYFPP